MSKEMNEMKAVFGRAFFGKNECSGSISPFQVLLVLEHVDDIFQLIQRIRNPGTYPSWKDYGAATALICRDAYLAAEIQCNSIPAPDSSRFKDFLVYEECEVYKIFKVKSSIANTRAHMERGLGGFVGENAGTTELIHSVQRLLAKTYAGIQNPTDKAKFIGEDSVRSTLLRDLAVQPLPAKAYTILFPNLINVNLPICKRLKDVVSATFRTLRNALKEVRSKKSRCPNIVSNGLSLFKSASKLAVGMVIIGNTPAVGATRTIAPEAVEPGSMQAEDFEKTSNFAFGIVACVGTLVMIIAFGKSVNCRRRHAIAGTSTASAPTGTILNRVGTMGQTLTVIRSWRETEFREVVVALREEEGAYAS